MTTGQLVRELEDLAVQLSWVGKEDSDDQDAIVKQCNSRRAKIIKKLKEAICGATDRDDRS